MHLIRQKESKKILKTTRDCGKTNSKSDCNVNHTLDRLCGSADLITDNKYNCQAHCNDRAYRRVITYHPKRKESEKDSFFWGGGSHGFQGEQRGISRHKQSTV